MTIALKTCKKCGQEKPIDRFASFVLRSGVTTQRGDCWECRGAYAKDNFERLVDYRRSYNANNRSKKQERDRQNKVNAKIAIDKIKDVPCLDCGNRFPPVAMDFDHIGPKSKSIAEMVSQGYKLQLILEEIAKCEIICACCHRVRTAKRKQNAAPYVAVAPHRSSTMITMDNILALFSPGLFLSISEISERLGNGHVPITALKQLIKDGKLLQVRLGRHRYCLPETVKARFSPSDTAANASLSLRSRILALFMENSNAEFSAGEIIRFLSINRSTAYSALHLLTRNQELVRSKHGLYKAQSIPVDWRGKKKWHARKLTLELAKEILAAINAGERMTVVAQRYNVDPATVRNIRDGRIWKAAQNIFVDYKGAA